MPQVIITSPKLSKIKLGKVRDEYMKPRKWHITSSTTHGSFTVRKLMEYVNSKTER